jgi:uncharacterized protein (TIGR03086 family)
VDIQDLYRRTVAVWTARAATVTTDQWGTGTPCADWAVRDLVNHVVGEDLWTVHLVQGRTIADVGDALDGNLLGDRPLDVAQRAADDAVLAVAQAAPNGGKVHLSYGEEDLGEYLHQLAADHLIHAWDLAVAVGGDTALDADLVEEVGGWFAEREELYRSAGMIGPRVEVGEDAQSRLLGAAGRDPSWTPR